MIAYNWISTGPGGCDNHCVEHPCGKCATDCHSEEHHAQKIAAKDACKRGEHKRGIGNRCTWCAFDLTPEHECDEGGPVDIDLCTGCGEHAGFCSICELSNCCGTRPHVLD